MLYLSTLVAGASLLHSALASNYLLVDNYQGSNFVNMMDFFTGGDPTHGYVNYVDQGTAQNQGLYSLSGNTVYLGVDHTNVASGAGRNSIRVTSKKSYTHMLLVADLQHNPGGVCGTWPAFWTVGPNWPNDGEIDIFEGVNSQSTNFMTLHTSANCAVTGAGDGLLQPFSEDCNAADNGNAGCSFHETNSISYGNDMNSNGGAQYAMEWTSSGIKIWWWNARNPHPADMFSGNPNPANWGPPSANWNSAACNIDGHFSSHQIVFDTTFCGDWGGAVWGSDSQCAPKASSCQAYVQNNPGAFANAYWSIADLKVYQNNGQNNDRRDIANETVAAEAEAAEIAEQLLVTPTTPEKRAAASQVAPSLVPTESRTVNAAAATSAAVAEAVRMGWTRPPGKRDIVGEARRARYMRA